MFGLQDTTWTEEVMHWTKCLTITKVKHYQTESNFEVIHVCNTMNLQCRPPYFPPTAYTSLAREPLLRCGLAVRKTYDRDCDCECVGVCCAHEYTCNLCAFSWRICRADAACCAIERAFHTDYPCQSPNLHCQQAWVVQYPVATNPVLKSPCLESTSGSNLTLSICKRILCTLSEPFSLLSCSSSQHLSPHLPLPHLGALIDYQD